MYREEASRSVPGAVVWRTVRAADGSVLPDGCTDLVWRDGVVVVAGPDTEPFTVPASSEMAVGLRFPPGLLPHLLGVPASDLQNLRVPLDDVVGRRAAPLRGIDPGDAADAFEAFGCALLAGSGMPDPAVTATARLLAAGATVTVVADTTGLSPRTLHRLSARHFGYGPKTLSSILRLQRALALAGRGLPSVDVATACGYVDQAHLIRESRRITGLPFGELRQDPSGANRSTPLPSGSTTVA
ncbi:helix-turn-helix domain-containing protein [Prescottella sp. R16]|uniref:helix-turn-helix domain-containing protein n=1 Tax=Prescottella sp. R16 TaxID=3064529 RepID=UPI00272DE507|nr:helix-turn-helix domain-containing protein [Prescottella sp. R16]